MAYTRQYPNSITPQGTTTRGCLENDDKELKRVLDLISSTNGTQLSNTKRQCVMYGPTDSSGNPIFLTANGLHITIDGSDKPVILSFASGYSAIEGTVDILDAITSKINDAWTVPANGTYYLYIDKDINTGLISYGNTSSIDTYSKTSPSNPVLDQCWFNTIDMKMYHYNGSAWEYRQRVFVAKAVSTSSDVTITHYPMSSRVPIRLESAELAGNTTAVTPDASSNSTQVATTEFVKRACLDIKPPDSKPLDATLTAIAGLETSPDEMIYSTGKDTFSMTGITSLARSLLSQTSQYGMRNVIAANADNCGGIIDYGISTYFSSDSQYQNFVMFSNELLIQWGVSSSLTGDTNTITLPISYNSNKSFIPFVMAAGGDATTVFGVNWNTQSSFVVTKKYGSNSAAVWLTIGS